MGSRRLSDREQAGLRGPVKTCNDFMGDDVESRSETEYAADGRLLVWRGRTFTGRVERVYSYDAIGRLIGVTGGNADVTDEFYYDEQGKKTRVRTVPPRPGHEGVSIGVSIMFEVAEEGDSLNSGGSVTTRYNDDDQPIESLVRDAQGELLTKIVRYYANGRLVNETLVREAFERPVQLRDQLSEEQWRAFRAQSKAFLGHDAFKNMERSYFYDDAGRVSRQLMRMGNLQQDKIITYNEHGDKAVTVTIKSGSLDPRMPDLANERSEVNYLYQYDSHDNWTERTTTSSHRIGNPNTQRRTLAYY
jgi:YD repeat-containing protein